MCVAHIIVLFQLTKETLDDYIGGQPVPAFQFELRMVEPGDLEQRVEFVGVTPARSFITITRSGMFPLCRNIIVMCVGLNKCLDFHPPFFCQITPMNVLLLIGSCA